MNLTAEDNPENPLSPIVTTNYAQNPTDCAPGDLSCLFTYDPPQETWDYGMTVTITATATITQPPATLTPAPADHTLTVLPEARTMRLDTERPRVLAAATEARSLTIQPETRAYRLPPEARTLEA